MGEIKRYSIQEAAALWSKISTYEGDAANIWKNECIDNRKFYEGEQYTAEEKKLLNERGQYDIVINKIRKAIKGMVGLVSSSIPKYKLIPVGKADDTKAFLGNQLLDWVWDNSGGIHTYRDAVKSALIDNLAYLFVYQTKDKRIKFTKLEFDEVIVDPNSRHPLFDDAEMIMIRRYVPVEYVKEVFGIDAVVTEIPNEFFNVSPTLALTANTAFLGRVFDTSRRYVNLYECYRKVGNQYATDFRSKIVKETIIGYMHAYVEELPDDISNYPIIPIYVEGNANPYKRGEVRYLKTIQRFINKTYGVTLLNAQLMSNPKIYVRDRDIPRGDIDSFTENHSTPGSVNVLTGDANPPIVVSGQPLNNAFFNLYMDAKQEFEWLTVPNQLLGYGNPNQTRNSDLLDVKESSLESLKDFLTIVESACSRLGLVCLEYIQAYAEEDMIINIPDNKGARQSVELNKKQGLDVDNDQSVTQFIAYMKQNKVPDEEIQETLAKAKKDAEYVKELKYVLNETNFSQFDVRVIPGSYSPTYQMAMLRLMMELSQAGAVDPSVVLEYAPVENREDLIKRFDLVETLKSKNFQLEEELNTMKQLYWQSNQASMTSEKRLALGEHELKLRKIELDMKVKALAAKFKNKLDTQEQMMKLEDIIRDVIVSTKQEMFKETLKHNAEMAEATHTESIEDTVEKALYGDPNVRRPSLV